MHIYHDKVQGCFETALQFFTIFILTLFQPSVLTA